MINGRVVLFLSLIHDALRLLRNVCAIHPERVEFMGLIERLHAE